MKKFVCHSCSTEKTKGPEFTGTRCPECGEKMTLEGTSEAHEMEKSKEEETEQSKRIREIYQKRSKSKKKEGSGYPFGRKKREKRKREKQWEKKKRWVASILPLLLWCGASIAVLATLNRLGLSLREGLIVLTVMSTPVLAAHVWVLLKEEEWGRSAPWGVAVFFTLMLVPGVLGAEQTLEAVAGSLGFAVAMSFLWIWAIRIGSVSNTVFSQKSQSGATNTSSRKRSVRGYVYVAENPEIPGKVKIGYTTRDVRKRMRELSRGTGVPGKYKATYKFGVARPKRVEKKVHRRLSHQKIQDGGEFFRVEPEKAAKVIKEVRG